MLTKSRAGKRTRYLLTTLILAGAVATYGNAASKSAMIKNGFDLSNASIPAEEILHGGPAKDGIPAINDPQFIRDPSFRLST